MVPTAKRDVPIAAFSVAASMKGLGRAAVGDERRKMKTKEKERPSIRGAGP